MPEVYLEIDQCMDSNMLRNVQADSGPTVRHLTGITTPRLVKRNVCEAATQGDVRADLEKDVPALRSLASYLEAK